LKGPTKEVDEVGNEDEDDNYQSGIDDDEDDEGEEIQCLILTW